MEICCAHACEVPGFMNEVHVERDLDLVEVIAFIQGIVPVAGFIDQN